MIHLFCTETKSQVIETFLCVTENAKNRKQTAFLIRNKLNDKTFVLCVKQGQMFKTHHFNPPFVNVYFSISQYTGDPNTRQ